MIWPSVESATSVRWTPSFLKASAVLQIAAGKHWSLDSSVDGPGQSIAHGVVLGDGDGTVPLVSLGYMCASAWQTEELNPSGMKACSSPRCSAIHSDVLA